MWAEFIFSSIGIELKLAVGTGDGLERFYVMLLQQTNSKEKKEDSLPVLLCKLFWKDSDGPSLDLPSSLLG